MKGWNSFIRSVFIDKWPGLFSTIFTSIKDNEMGFPRHCTQHYVTFEVILEEGSWLIGFIPISPKT